MSKRSRIAHRRQGPWRARRAALSFELRLGALLPVPESEWKYPMMLRDPDRVMFSLSDDPIIVYFVRRHVTLGKIATGVFVSEWPCPPEVKVIVLSVAQKSLDRFVARRKLLLGLS